MAYGLGSARTDKQKKSAKARAEAQQYARGMTTINSLKKQYDAKKGGYTIPGGSFGLKRRKDKFIKSNYTPEQGGYYRDYDIPALRKEEQEAAARQAKQATGEVSYTGTKPKRTKADTAEDVIFAAERLSRAKPFQRVNPSITRSRTQRKRSAAGAAGRGNTILTKRLGSNGDDEPKNKRTILGG